MPRPVLSRFCLFFLFAILVFGRNAYALDVTDIRLGAHPDKTRLVIAVSDASSFRAFMLADPVRLVVDLPAFRWTVGEIAKPPGTGIRDIRQGPLQPGFSRIAIDIEKPSVIKSAFTMPPADGQSARIVIDFGPAASAAQFDAARNRIHGSLTIENTVTARAPSPGIAGNIADGIGAPARKPPAPPAKSNNAYKPMIVIDAGHGGDDPGAIGANGLKEKNITIAMARDLKAALENTGRYRVSLTRDKDIFLKLYRRVAIARERRADLFISLHADSINRSGVKGASIYTLSEKASDAETEKLAARENHADLIAGVDLSHEDEDVANILVDLAMRDTMNQSKFFAGKTVSFLRSGGIKTLDNPHRSAGFAVLKAPDIPSVLIELGYMSNSQESAMLSKPEYRARIATALTGSIDAYFETVTAQMGP